ncbi:hypothetical protein V5J35_002917 [Endozoicomonas sp. NE40]|uniref:Transposase n=1 Tax=Endozoicomonas lisbonensis TaxID=3120522 RepID=A0ABV2SIZ2_9GAMM
MFQKYYKADTFLKYYDSLIEMTVIACVKVLCDG